MRKKDVGVFQMENGYWAYRFKMVVDGKEISRRKSTDEHGNKLNNKTEAIKARESAMVAARTERQRQRKISRRTIKEVFEEYREKGCSGKAYKTLLKQDSLWKNHFSEKWGKRYVDDISAAEINDYLAELYFEHEYAYRYVESFLKVFYLIFGQAYSRNYMDVDTYNKLCVNKDTKIHMPKLRVDDDTDIIAFSRSQLLLLDEYFEGTNAETAYLLGRYCGLRINETYGLKWDHVDLEAGTIFIDRQQQYQDGLIKLVPTKTRNAKRTIYLCDKMLDHLKKKKEQAEKDAVRFAAVRAQKQRFIEDLNGSTISCTDLVNCLPDGTIQTVNSMKYPTREIKEHLGIQYKYHYLRHTYGTLMAEMNTPTHLLCNQMGHGNIHVTQLYYLAVSETGIDALKARLNEL
jgi:integrase